LYGQEFIAKDKKNNLYELIALEKQKLFNNGYYKENIQKEIQELYLIQSEHLIKIKDFFEDNTFYYLISPFYKQNLEKHIQYLKSKNLKMEKKNIIQILTQLKDLIQEVKNYNINIQIPYPINIFIDENIKEMFIKIKKKYFWDRPMDHSLSYLSPEEKNNMDNYKTMLWAIGILANYLFYQNYNLDNKNNENQPVDIEIKNFSSELLKTNFNERMEWENYFEHKLFKEDFFKKKEEKPKKKVIIGDYEILGNIGKGAFSEVYKARNIKTGKQVAFKKINLKFMDKKNVEEEIELSKKCDCKSSVKLLDHFIHKEKKPKENEEEYYCLIQEMCSDTLENFIKKQPDLTTKQIRKFLLQMNVVLRKMLKVKKIHGNLKPSNIMIKVVDESLNLFQVKLGDFGISSEAIAKAKINPNLTSAPEVIFKQSNTHFNEKIDIWSLGTILYFMKFKEYPYKMEDFKKIEEKCKGKTSLTPYIQELKKIKVKTVNDNKDLAHLLRKTLNVYDNQRILWKGYFESKFFYPPIGNIKKHKRFKGRFIRKKKKDKKGKKEKK
jgi:serine/threonine protein kinase